MYGELEFLYDDNGNMIQKTLRSLSGVEGAAVNYIYNADNRLIKVEDDLTGTVIAEYYYDPFGRRLWKEVGGSRTYFFYSDEGLIAEYDASGNELKAYGYQPDSTWTTDPLFLKQNGSYYFYQNDHLGTPQKLVAQNGAVVWSATYSAFGEATVDVSAITNNLRFPGQYFDAETGLHYNFQRYYDPGIGRYLQQDPKGLHGGLNFFAYTFNNPLKNSDPQGLGVHPHQIIPANKAEWLVRGIAEGFPQAFMEAYKTGNENKRKNLWTIPPEYLLMKYLGDWVNKPGGRNAVGKEKQYPGFHNRFVFTCKYGWIDIGHFFNTAWMGYLLQIDRQPSGWRWLNSAHDWATDWIPISGWEYIQWMNWKYNEFEVNVRVPIPGFGLVPGTLFTPDVFIPNAESQFTTEDWWSNRLGTIFGKEVAWERGKHGLNVYGDSFGESAELRLEFGAMYIAEKWRDFLIASGAVQYDEQDKMHEKLWEDAMKHWEINNVPDDEDFEDQYARFNDEYRKIWEKIRCKSEVYRMLCCCCSNNEDSCDQAVHQGGCNESPLYDYYRFPRTPGALRPQIPWSE